MPSPRPPESTEITKRGNGEGSVYHDRTTGRWVAEVRINGTRRRAMATTEAQAKRRLRELQTTVGRGDNLGNGNTTVSQVLEHWQTIALPSRELSQRTIEVYEWCIEVLTETIGAKRLRSLTPEDIELAFHQLATTGRTRSGPISRSSLIKLRSVLGKALAHAERRQLVNRNVARIVELPIAARRPDLGRALTVEQAQHLLTVTAQHRLHALWLTMLLLGLRPGEATGLTWSDIDLDNAVIHIRRSLKLEAGRLHIDERLKTSRSRRSLDAPPQLVNDLRRHQAEQATEAAALGQASTNPDDLVFTTSTGGPLEPTHVRKMFSRLTSNAGLGHWHPHELRHSAASILSAAGVPLERIADVLGHDGTRMTALVYRHAITPTTNAALILGNLLTPAFEPVETDAPFRTEAP